jgi:hypothetical protein
VSIVPPHLIAFSIRSDMVIWHRKVWTIRGLDHLLGADAALTSG